MQNSNVTKPRLRPIDYAMWIAVTAGFITVILDVLVWRA